jgi:hypothetical protein
LILLAVATKPDGTIEAFDPQEESDARHANFGESC